MKFLFILFVLLVFICECEVAVGAAKKGAAKKALADLAAKKGTKKNSITSAIVNAAKKAKKKISQVVNTVKKGKKGKKNNSVTTTVDSIAAQTTEVNMQTTLATTTDSTATTTDSATTTTNSATTTTDSTATAPTSVATALADSLPASANPDAILDLSVCQASNHPLGNGTQIKTGFCSETIMGQVPNVNNMVSTWIVSPQDGDTIQLNTPLVVSCRTINMELGFFDNPNIHYYATPQSLNSKGQIQGHQHVVIEQITTPGTPLNPVKFELFKGLNDASADGVLSVNFTTGISSPGVHRICTMTGAFGHQPVIMPISKRGPSFDCIRINVGTTQSAAPETNNIGVLVTATKFAQPTIAPAVAPGASSEKPFQVDVDKEEIDKTKKPKMFTERTIDTKKHKK